MRYLRVQRGDVFFAHRLDERSSVLRRNADRMNDADVETADRGPRRTYLPHFVSAADVGVDDRQRIDAAEASERRCQS